MFLPTQKWNVAKINFEFILRSENPLGIFEEGPGESLKQ